MTTFRIRIVSGGIVRQTFSVEAVDLPSACYQLGPDAKVVNSCPGWAFVHCGALTSASISWDIDRPSRQPSNT